MVLNSGLPTDIWDMVVNPVKAVQKVIQASTLRLSIIVLLICVAFHFISRFILDNLFYPSGLSLKTLSMLSCFTFLLSFVYWLLGYSLIHFFSRKLGGKAGYVNLLKVGAYISVIGVPFSAGYFVGTRLISGTVFGLFSPFLFLINQIGVFLSNWGGVTIGLGPEVAYLVHVWLLVVTVIGIKEVYQLSLRRAIASLSISIIVFSLLSKVLVKWFVVPIATNFFS